MGVSMASFRGLRTGEVRGIPLLRLSEKGFEQCSRHDFGRNAEEDIPKEGSRRSVMLRRGRTLEKELSTFKRKINLATAHDSYEHWREGDHDDLVLAAALAVWSARAPGPTIVFV